MPRALLLLLTMGVSCSVPSCSDEPTPAADADADTDVDADIDVDVDSDVDSDADADPGDDGDPDREGPADADDASDAGPSYEPITVVFIADLNGSYGSTSYGAPVHDAVARIVTMRPDLVVSLGDMVAGQQAGLDYDAMWSAFHAAVSDPIAAAGIPFAVTPGNHDASGYASFEGERAIFVREWTARRPAVRFLDETHYPLRYSFVVGPALFVSLDATTVGPLSREQMDWLAAQLEAGREQPAAIVFGHLPLYPVSVGRETEIIGDPALEDLLTTSGVDLVLAGHDHAYYPGRRGALRLTAAACVGAGPRALLEASEPSPRSVLVVEVSATGDVRAEAYGGARYDEVIPRSGLPERVGTGDQVLMRDDL